MASFLNCKLCFSKRSRSLLTPFMRERRSNPWKETLILSCNGKNRDVRVKKSSIKKAKQPLRSSTTPALYRFLLSLLIPFFQQRWRYRQTQPAGTPQHPFETSGSLLVLLLKIGVGFKRMEWVGSEWMIHCRLCARRIRWYLSEDTFRWCDLFSFFPNSYAFL